MALIRTPGQCRLCRTAVPIPSDCCNLGNSGMHHTAPSTGAPSRAQHGAGAECSQPGRAMDPATLRGNQTAPGHGCGARFLPRPRGPCEGGG